MDNYDFFNVYEIDLFHLTEPVQAQTVLHTFSMNVCTVVRKMIQNKQDFSDLYKKKKLFYKNSQYG